MLDLETLSSKNNAAIVAIGAVEFDPMSNELGEKLHLLVNPDGVEELGFHISGSTFLWWLGQSEEARAAIIKAGGAADIGYALTCFSNWVAEVCPEGMYLWGNGADFDNAILGNAYKVMCRKQPWSYGKNRCFRTMKGIFQNLEPERQGVHHNALDDACHQARWLQAIFKKLVG